MSKRQIALADLGREIDRAMRYGYSSTAERLQERYDDVIKMTDEEFIAYDKVSKMYAVASVKPIIPNHSK